MKDSKTKILLTLLALTLLFACDKKKVEAKKVIFSQQLVDELSAMVAVDQFAARNAFPPDGYKHLDQATWEAKKDSIYRTHKIRLEEILNKYGYPGFDLIGEQGEGDYWVMAQHSDFDPVFQERVLKLLKIEVDRKNANSRNFGLLTDRVRLNTNRKQVYGTQTTYVKETGQAIPLPLEDSLSVNERRASIGLEPIEVYLNDMTLSHFQMNKKFMLELGITEPTLHELK